MMKYLTGIAILVLLASATASNASAQKFVYEPKNPAFGGSYLNYSWLMQSAEAQKDFESSTADRFARDPFQDFQQNMQRQILSQLSRELIYNRFRDLDMTKEGRFDLGDYLVEINPGLDGLSIRVFNMLTGDESVISIPNY